MNSIRFPIVADPTDEEMKELQKGLESFNLDKTNDEFNNPKPWISLVLRDHDNNIVGGIMTSTIYWVNRRIIVNHNSSPINAAD